jgi:hypothetical protein
MGNNGHEKGARSNESSGQERREAEEKIGQQRRDSLRESNGENKK